MTIDVSQFTAASRNNRGAILDAGRCCCYFCTRSFEAGAIKAWIDDGETALCPHCSIDALLPGVVEEAALTEGMNRYFFG